MIVAPITNSSIHVHVHKHSRSYMEAFNICFNGGAFSAVLDM